MVPLSFFESLLNGPMTTDDPRMCDHLVADPGAWKDLQSNLTTKVNLHWMDPNMKSFIDKLLPLEKKDKPPYLTKKMAVRSSFQS
jgi:hypothetical protein